MKNVRNVMLAIFMSFMVILSSCGTPTPEVVTVVVTATNQPATETPITEAAPSLAPVALGGPQGGETIKWIDGSVLVYVPEGTFTMGYGGDAPVHSISLTGYWIQQTKVTNRMYDQCVKAGICSSPMQELGGPVFTNPEFASHPVVGVTWDQAQAYCTWVQGSLPTEAQWEKAARGSDERKYPWGETVDCFHSNFWAAGASTCVGDTTTVGSYPIGASPYDVYDMAGNVWEWVNDSYNAIYYGSLPDGYENPTGPVRNLNSIVIRGGGWDSGINGVRAAYRGYQPYTYYANNLGFRCARTLTP